VTGKGHYNEQTNGGYMCTELPVITEFNEQMRFLDCGQMYRAFCKHCGDSYQSDIAHGCNAGMFASMDRDDERYNRAKQGRR
jgi:hypothetical protein